jgi:2-succinyl-5-enolpyruvyl-6-hydroxy-3-cyclohexene-1-carboxylate synthase
MESTAQALRAYVGAFVDELALCGVTDVVVCPGSRSTPLAMLVREHPKLKTWMHLDERSAAFFGLGISKATRRPAAVVCTSGTAAANFLPAVVEAKYGQTPLLVLTADRPQELRDVGALQTIDQVRLYGTHSKRFEEMLLPESTPIAVRHARQVADRAVATALASPPGPVHLNFPFREPLIPARAEGSEGRGSGSRQTAFAEPFESMPGLDIGGVVRTVMSTARGLVVCGAIEGSPWRSEDDDLTFATFGLARKYRVPILADGLSPFRANAGVEDTVIDRFDAFLRDEATAASLAFDYVLRIGAMPVSKPLQQFLDRNLGATQMLVAEGGAWPDPGRSATEIAWGNGLKSSYLHDVVESYERWAMDDGVPLAGGEERHAWLDAWRSANETAAVAIESELARYERMTEPLVFRRLAELVPEDAIVFAGNSMPVRDLDSFWPASTKKVRFLANRGASGIDGVVSTALGVAAASGKPTVLVLGDISLYHDMNGLFAAKRHAINATVIVLNNDGGAIFSFLPQADQGEHFEELFGTPHGLDFRHTAALYGLEYACPETPDDFDAAVARSLKSTGVSLIEVRTDRAENLALHRDIWAKVAEALARDRERAAGEAS